MNRISTKALDELANSAAAVSELWDELEALAQRFSDEAAALTTQIEDASNAAREVMEEAANDAESFYDDKSERWQEGDRGQAYAEWRDRLRQLADALGEAIDPPEVQMPDRPEWVDELREPDFAEPSY